MTQLKSLLWKEWHEARPYLWIGLGLFLGLPVVAGLERVWFSSHRFELSASPWVTTLGGVLAVFVAVGVTTADRRPRLEDFWRSRPIGVTRWLATKYGVALAVVLAACGVPLGVELAVNRETDVPAAVLTFMPFFWAAMFSLAFLAGCVVNRPAHAATLGLAAMLLVYAVPVIVPPLRWMNVADYTEGTADRRGAGQLALWLRLWGPRQVGFACGMLGLSVVATATAAVAMRRGWRIESGRKTLYGLLAAAFLLLFASAAFQLATNLPVLARVELPEGERIQTILPDGAGGGRIITATYTPSREHLPPGYYNGPEEEHDWSRTVQAGPNGLTLGAPVGVDLADDRELAWPMATHRRHGRYAYWAPGDDPGPKDALQPFHLYVYDNLHWDKPIASQPLWDQPVHHADPTLYVWHDTLYAFGDRLRTFDISAPDGVPRQTSDVPLAQPIRRGGRSLWRDRQLTLKLLPLPGMPAADRLAATVWLLFPMAYSDSPCFDGHLLCMWGDEKDGTLVGYRLARADENSATFDEIGRFHPTLLQRWVNGFDYYTRLTLADGRVYLDGLNTNGTFNSGVTILDLAGPRPMRPLGHFAAPGAEMIRPLPDGRAIVGGGNKLWLVGAPPH